MEGKLTQEEVNKIYNFLDKEDENSNKDKLEESSKETDTTMYFDLEPMKETPVGVTFGEDEMRKLGLSEETIESLKDIEVDDVKDINETDADYLDVFKDYDISEEDGMELLKTISEYKIDNNSEGLYDKLPDTLKKMANGFVDVGKHEGVKVSKDNAASTIINEFIHDAKFGKAMDDFNLEMNKVMMNSTKEYQMLMNDYVNNLYKNIDIIREEDPEKAETLDKLKQAFEDSITFKKQLEFLDHTSAKKLKKALNNYDQECFYFNKKVNSTEIKIPDIRELYPIIKKGLPNFTEMQIKEFIIVICKSCYKLDVNNIEELAYIYRALERVFAFKYVTDYNTDLSKEVFGNVSVVIKKIINLDKEV